MASKAVTLIERQDWLESLEQSAQEAIHKAFDSMGASGQKIRDFLHGKWLGHPLHSALTDVPVGAWTAALVFDFLDDKRYGRAADQAISIGLVGAVAAAAAGLTDWHQVDGRARRVGLVHGLMNIKVAGLYTMSLLLRRRKQRDAGRTLAFTAYAIAMASAYLGGKLVYSEKIGVDHSKAQEPPRDFVTVLREAELGEGQPRRVDVQGARVLLIRRGERILALAETCAHLGGPLSEGKIEGDVVECPWHGSRYSLADGSVVQGPSVHPQPSYEARVRDGQIEVRIKHESA